jgi:transposase
MAFGYRPVDRDQQFLLPPDVREWLPAGHLVWFLLDVVERIDTAALHTRHARDGVGRRAFDPDMLLALLLYAYCTGQRSSRRIEQLCEVDVAYRVICANDPPDHTTIARFRQRYDAHAKALFIEVLSLCHEAGLTKVGVVAVDGTKIAADASLKANRTRAQIEAEIAAQVDEMMAEADDVDAAEDDLFGDRRGDELPDDLVDRSSRRRRLDEALEQLKAKQARREADEAERDEQWRRAMAGEGPPPRFRPKHDDPVEHARRLIEVRRQRAARRRADVVARAQARGQRPRGQAPGPGHRVAAAEAKLAAAEAGAACRTAEASPAASDPPTTSEPRANVVDPDSRMMHTQNGWVQGYNAQAAVTEHGVVVAAEVTNEHNDVGQCQPMMAATKRNLRAIRHRTRIGTMLFDAGYWSNENATAAGPPRLIATGKVHTLRKKFDGQPPPSGPPPPEATPAEAMEHRLRTTRGTKLYAKRQHTIEPVFGQIKHDRGMRRFVRRGLDAVQSEWQLITTAHNLLKLANSNHRFT